MDGIEAAYKFGGINGLQIYNYSISVRGVEVNTTGDVQTANFTPSLFRIQSYLEVRQQQLIKGSISNE